LHYDNNNHNTNTHENFGQQTIAMMMNFLLIHQVNWQFSVAFLEDYLTAKSWLKKIQQ
jgi:hypothetical protein